MKLFRFIILSLLLLCLSDQAYGQSALQLYNSAMDLYRKGAYKESAESFDKLYEAYGQKLSETALYDEACIYSLNNEKDKALKLLEYAILERYYSDIKHITNDKDLTNLHSDPRWGKIVEGVNDNIKTSEQRLIKTIKEELLKAKKILAQDNGKLWGEQIWDDHIIVLTQDNTIYSLIPLQGSQVADSIIYVTKIPENTLGFSNAIQDYQGEKYAVIIPTYLNDNSSTIIHELFHILQLKHRMLNGNAINYMDNYDVREWLRLEYQALRNCLNAIDNQKSKDSITIYLNDAMLFRKLRQTKYAESLSEELEIETLEGLANYTGFVLSTYPNLYKRAIEEIDQREQAPTYTRTFPYATGLAYGLIFDYLNIDWKQGLDSVYNFYDIYKRKYLKREIPNGEKEIAAANKRSNYEVIHKQETERKDEHEKTIAALRKLFIQEPTLSVTIKDNRYGRTFDMNGTIVIQGLGIAHITSINGVDGSSGANFGNFQFHNDKIGSEEISGILMSFDGMTYTFPTPFEVKGNKIIGKTYQIELNKNWVVKRENEKGDFEIIEDTGL